MTAPRMDITTEPNAGRMSDLEIRARALMKRRRIKSKAALSERAGVSLQSLHGWFRLGRTPGVVSRYKMERVLGVDLWDEEVTAQAGPKI